MLLSPLTTSTPLLSLPACKIPSAKLQTKPASSSSVPQLTSLQSFSKTASSTASTASVSIPSPPPTPHLGYEYDKSENEGIFSARFRDQNNMRDDAEQVDDELSLSLHSSSAPSAMSPLQMRLASSAPTGFTFSSNITTSVQSKKDRESYEYFMNTMEEDYWKSVSTIRTTYFFDGIGRGGGFLAIPHLASHGNAKTNVICRMLEAWLTEKLVEPTISDSIPVLEDNIESSVQSIEQHLRQDPKVWSGISKSFIHIRCGHVFMLDTCCDDETIVHLGADEFYQDYPLFVDVEIKMHCDSNHLPRDHSTEILIAFQNVVNKNRDGVDEKPYVHKVTISEPKHRRSMETHKAAAP